MGMPVISPSEVDRDQSVTDIIQSVALEQAALSHILNAEGEKMQKIAADETATTQDLLDNNKAVRAMVQSITHLEMVLQSKLGLFENAICQGLIDQADAAVETKKENTNNETETETKEPQPEPTPADDTQKVDDQATADDTQPADDPQAADQPQA